MPLNTEMPAWLAQQFGPSPPSSPWILQALQQGMERQRMQQLMPLEIQQAQLANQLQEARVENEGLRNEALSMDIQQFKAETPIVNEWLKAQVGRSPVDVIDDPGPAVRHPEHLKSILDFKKAQSQTYFAQQYEKDQVELGKVAAEATMEGYDVESAMMPGPNGTYRWDRKKLSEISAEMQATKLSREVVKRQASTAWHTAPGVGMKYSRAEIEAQGLMRAQEQLDQALATGDPALIAKYEQNLANVRKFQEQQIRPGQMFATEAEARAREQARNRIDEAYEIGDPEMIQKAEQYLSDLEEAILRQRRNPVQTQELNILSSRIRTIDRKLIADPPGMWPALEQERERLLQQLRQMGAKPGGSNAPAATEPGTNAPPALKRRVFRNGRFE